jgi:hypothetical protein
MIYSNKFRLLDRWMIYLSKIETTNKKCKKYKTIIEVY